jgi:hypothetical protein
MMPNETFVCCVPKCVGVIGCSILVSIQKCLRVYSVVNCERLRDQIEQLSSESRQRHLRVRRVWEVLCYVALANYPQMYRAVQNAATGGKKFKSEARILLQVSSLIDH